MISTIRAAITEWLQEQAAESDNIGTIYAVPPRITPTGAFGLPSAPSSPGAMVFVYIASSNQKLITLGGPTSGVYSGDYTVNLVVVVQNVEGTVDSAQATMDGALADLTRAIMANRTANAAGTIFVWGLGNRDGDGVDLSVNMELPLDINQRTIMIWGSIEVQVQELTQEGETI